MKCAKCAHVWTALPVEAEQTTAISPQDALEPTPQPSNTDHVSQASQMPATSQRDRARSEDIDRWEEDLKEERAAEEARTTSEGRSGSTVENQTAFQQFAARSKTLIETTRWLRFIATNLRVAASTEWQNLIRLINWARGLSFANQMSLLAAMLMPILLVTGLFAGRQFMVRQFPDLASLYAIVGIDVNLYGLEFEDVQTVRRPEDGVAVLVVEGAVRNITGYTKNIPRLHFILSGRNREVYAWQDDAPQKPLEPGETVQFRSVLASPPDVADELHVRFLSNDPRLNRL